MESCIVYFSQADNAFESQLEMLLAQSRQRNAELGITGVMLYMRGSIIQVLEGEHQQLEALYQRIEADPRHRQVERILTRPIDQRLFADWHMGYLTISQFELSELKAVLPLDEIAKPQEPLVLRVIQTFYQAHR